MVKSQRFQQCPYFYHVIPMAHGSKICNDAFGVSSQSITVLTQGALLINGIPKYHPIYHLISISNSISISTYFYWVK
jgi:hypothetical protein